MNRKLIFALLFSILIFLFSCKEKSPAAGEGWVSLSFKANVSTNVKSPETHIFSITILDSKSDTVKHYDDFNDMPDRISLQNGLYTAICESDNIKNTAIFDEPSFRGVKDFEVRPRGTTVIDIEAKIAEVKVTVNFTDAFKAAAKSYKTLIRGDLGYELEFIAGETRAGYIKVKDSILYNVALVNNVNETINFSSVKKGLKPADHLKLEFDISKPEGDINATLRVFVDVTINDVKYRFEMDRNGANLPNITPANFDPTKEILVEDETLPASTITINSEDGLEGVYMKVNTGFLESLGLPRWINLLTLSPSQKESLIAQGLIFKDATTLEFPVQGSKNTLTLDFQNIAGKFPAGKNKFEISAISSLFAESKMLLNFDVVGNPIKMESVETTSIFNTLVDGNKARFNGYWTSTKIPEGLTFKYKVGTADWIIIDPSKVVLDENKKEYHADIFVPQNSDITVGALTYVDGAIVAEGSGSESFKSLAIPTVPNLSFDSWTSSGSGNTTCFYPNASGNSFWATGNEGTTASPVSQRSVTKPEDVVVVSGRAVRMESDAISFALSPVKFAAGNLFIGSYKTNMTNPAASVSFGKGFSGRPDQLKGYYYYIPSNYSGGLDGKDLCHIYIVLENRSSGTTRVGYGEVLDNRTMSGYEPFTINIGYSSTLPVTHITISVTSSRDGGNFKGGVGSVLYVDEFQLIYNGI